MKVLFVSYDGMTDALGRSQVMPYLQGLSALGYKIWIISCEKPSVPLGETLEVTDILSQSGIEWLPLRFTSHPPWVSKLADVIQIINTARRLHRKIGFDIVHCRSYIAALAGLYLKKQYGVSFVFDMRGFWANERVEGGMWRLSNPFHRMMYEYFKGRESEFFGKADAVVSLTHTGKGVIKEMFGENVAAKTTVIPCCVDTSLFDPAMVRDEERFALQKHLGLTPDMFVLSYLGSIGTWYMTAEMMRFYGSVLKWKPSARFLFISGDSPDSVKRVAINENIDPSRIIVVRASRNQVPLYLSLSNLSVFFIKPVFSKKASSPTKQAEIMSMGIPMVCNSGVGDIDLLFKDAKEGVVVNGFQNVHFEEALGKLDGLLDLEPSSIRKKAVETFNLKDGVKKYHDIYQKIKGHRL